MATIRTMGTAAALLVLMMSGCSSAKPSASGTVPPARLSTPTSSSARTTSTPAQDAGDQAAAFVPTYLRMLDDLYVDASRPLDDIYQVAVTPDATAEATAIGKFRTQGFRQTGRSQLVSATPTSVLAAGSSAPSVSPTMPTVVVTACVDVSQVDALAPSGKSVIPPDRPRYLIERLTVVNAHYPDAAGWRVSAAPNRQAQSCAG